jgi:O-antigen/teichoic acid export membrane protein
MLLKNTIYSSINSALRFFSSALLYIILARALGVEEFGRLMFALSFTGIFLTFIDYGFNLLIVKEVSQKPESLKNLVSYIINAKILLSIIFTIILIITLKILNSTDDTLLIVGILWLSAIFYSFGFFFNNIFRGLNRFQYETYPAILLNASQFVIVGVFLLLGFKILSIAIAYFLARFFYFSYSVYLLSSKVSKISFAFNLSESIKSLKIALPYGVHAILATLYFQIDTVFLSYFKGDVEVGYYQAAMRILMATMMVYEVVISAFFPVIAASIKNDKEKFDKYALFLNKVVIYIGLVFGIGIFIFSKPIISLLYGAQYQNSIIIMQVLAVVIFLRFLGAGYALFITVAEGQKYRAIGVSLSVVVSIILNIILIPKYGAIGAAIASLITHVVLNSIYFYFSVKLTNRVFVDTDLLFSALIIISSLLLIFINLNLIFSLVLFVICVIVSFVLVVKNSDIIKSYNKKVCKSI